MSARYCRTGCGATDGSEKVPCSEGCPFKGCKDCEWKGGEAP